MNPPSVGRPETSETGSTGERGGGTGGVLASGWQRGWKVGGLVLVGWLDVVGWCCFVWLFFLGWFGLFCLFGLGWVPFCSVPFLSVLFRPFVRWLMLGLAA